MDLLGDSENEDHPQLNINENYANRYTQWRQSEELQKLKDKYGDDEEVSSTSEEEDEDAVELTEKIEADFFKTLAYLKEKNPKIYDGNQRFFEKKDPVTATKTSKESTMSMAEYKRKMLLETEGIIEEEEQADQDNFRLPLVEQEKILKDSFKSALKNDSDSDGEDLFKPKVKTAAEVQKEDSDYRLWLAGQTDSAPKDSKELKGLRDFWANPNLDDGEKYLRDYLLNHRYLESKEKGRNVNCLSDSEEEGTYKEQEEFERKFNFRFEEPDQDFIKRYPRTVEQSMRKKDDRRIKHREEVKERKLKERSQKDEELKRLKALKRAEIMDKIKKLQEITGNDEMTFQNDDVDGDFDPAEHDRRMSELFNDSYYETHDDAKKPEFPELDEELELENWDQWDADEKEENGRAEFTEAHCEDADFVMDCDYDPSLAAQEEIKDSVKRRRKRKQSKFAQALANPKPKFDPTNSKFEKYLDEYYSLNYEDLIGDIPCRFKYRKTVPNDFGLSIEEILEAPDKELNRWASCKKIMRRRPEHVELYEVKAYRAKAKDINKKRQCLPSLYAMPENDIEEKGPTLETQQNQNASTIKRKRKKGKKTSEFPLDQSSTSDEIVRKKKKVQKSNVVASNDIDRPKKTKGEITGVITDKNLNKLEEKKKRKKITKSIGKPKKLSSDENETKRKNQPVDSNPILDLSYSRLKSYGLNPKKFKNKLKYAKQK